MTIEFGRLFCVVDAYGVHQFSSLKEASKHAAKHDGFFLPLSVDAERSKKETREALGDYDCKGCGAPLQHLVGHCEYCGRHT